MVRLHKRAARGLDESSPGCLTNLFSASKKAPNGGKGRMATFTARSIELVKRTFHPRRRQTQPASFQPNMGACHASQPAPGASLSSVLRSDSDTLAASYSTAGKQASTVIVVSDAANITVAQESSMQNPFIATWSCLYPSETINLDFEKSELHRTLTDLKNCHEEVSYASLEKDYELAKMRSKIAALRTQLENHDGVSRRLERTIQQRNQTIGLLRGRVEHIDSEKASALRGLKDSQDMTETLMNTVNQCAQDNMQVITNTASQLSEQRAKIAYLEAEKASIIEEGRGLMGRLIEENKLLKDYSVSLDRTDKDTMAGEAANNKAEADYCYQQMMRLRSKAGDHASMPSDYPKMVEQLKNQYTELENRYSDRVSELSNALQQSQTTMSGQHASIMSLTEKIGDLVRKYKLLQDELTRTTVYNEELFEWLSEPLSHNDIEASTRLHLQLKEVSIKKVIEMLDADDDIKAKQASKVEEQARLIEEYSRRIKTLEAEVKRLDSEKAESSVDLMKIEMSHETLKGRAKKAIAAKDKVIQRLNTEVKSAEGHLDRLGQQTAETQQFVVLEQKNNHIAALEAQLEESENEVKELRQRESDRCYTQQLDMQIQAVRDESLEHYQTQLRTVEKACFDAGFNPWKGRTRGAPSKEEKEDIQKSRDSSSVEHDYSSLPHVSLGSVVDGGKFVDGKWDEVEAEAVAGDTPCEDDMAIADEAAKDLFNAISQDDKDELDRAYARMAESPSKRLRRQPKLAELSPTKDRACNHKETMDAGEGGSHGKPLEAGSGAE